MRNSGIDALSNIFGVGLNISRLLPNDDIIRMTSANKMFKMFGGDTEIRDRALGGKLYARREKEFFEDRKNKQFYNTNAPEYYNNVELYEVQPNEVDHLGNFLPADRQMVNIPYEEQQTYKPRTAIKPPWRGGMPNNNVRFQLTPGDNFKGYTRDDTSFRSAAIDENEYDALFNTVYDDSSFD